ncbi:MAG TPA: alpha-glucosidase C-terminal domain-containing protein, partial [Phnomibacter sp.]|nr:alpha-glucosidase C-terminal domain-containing protein [Phnomibacter sp.]
DAWTHEEGFDLSYPWKAFHAMVDIAGGKKTANYLDSVLTEVYSVFPANALQMYFTSNHDENSWNKADYGTMPGAVHAPFAVLTQTWARSVPLIYSGQEEPFLDSISFFYKDTITFGKYERAPFYQALLNLRASNPALAANAAYTKINAGDPKQVFAFTREKEGKKVLVVLNLSGKEAAVTLPDAGLAAKPSTFISSMPEVPAGASYTLAPWGYAVYAY